MLLQNKNIIEKIALSLIQKWVKEFKIAVILGGVAIYEPKPRKFFNRLFFISENGKILCTYDKIHLFDVKVKGDRAYQESTTITPGKKPVLFRWKGLRFGLSICYDLRFPELYRKLSKKGAQVFVTPSSFTVPTGTAHWDVLTRARAIENLSYVIAPAQEGEHTNGRKTFGHTRIISPWGEVLQELKKGEGLVYEDIDLSFLEQKRAQLPALKHRKIT